MPNTTTIAPTALSGGGLDSAGFVSRASAVAESLRRDLVGVLNTTSMPRHPRGRVPLGVHPTLRSRLGRALGESDPLSCLFHMPGPEGLRQVLTTLANDGAEPAALFRCQERVREFEEFLDGEEATRETLQTILAGFVPEAREASFRASAQGAFRSMSQLVGSYAETLMVTKILCPGSMPDRFTLAQVRGAEGWRRLRPDAWYIVHGYTPYVINAAARGGASTTLDGVPLANLAEPPLLSDFCSQPLPKFVQEPAIVDQGPSGAGPVGGESHRLDTREVGARSACTFYFGERSPDSGRRFSSPEEDMALFSMIIGTPAKRLIFDVLVHDAVWAEPSVISECYRMVPRGAVAGDRAATLAVRAVDRVPDGESLRQLPLGLTGFESTGMRNHRAIIEDALRRLSLNVEEFRGYRCEVEYPIYGCQYVLRFGLPTPPPSAS